MSIDSIHPTPGNMPENGTMDSIDSRPEQPRRRSISPAQKLAYLDGYEQAIQTGEGRGYLRANALYSSQIVEWRRLRDAGVLGDSTSNSFPARSSSRLSKEQAEIARLKKQLAANEQKLATTQTALEIMGKGTRALGTNLEERGFQIAAQDLLSHVYEQLVTGGVSTRQASSLAGVSRATMNRRQNAARAGRALRATAPRPAPANKLTAQEETTILATLNSERFVDQAPEQIHATLLSEGTYLCSVSSMYRLLRRAKQVAERRRQARHPARKVPELVADQPGEVFTWDITKLAGPTKGVYFDAYVMIDIYSRYIIGCQVHTRESGELARDFIAGVFAKAQVPKVVHADRGTSMTSKPVAALLADLDVLKSHSRPKVSNDNPFSEAWFKTLKYLPTFPQRFGSLVDARAFMDRFVQSYNGHHRHSGIGFHTPADVHFGMTGHVDDQRLAALQRAWDEHPERFGRRRLSKKLQMPEAAWINEPVKRLEGQEMQAG
ncbi:IS3-like element ISAar44 family transposase [Glutamicibacter arilaitensis]|uniref:IS3-like element ISAar44 family transposase n=1 Tax=Glutamicibacter arilaitensis TaxID=256701 RepID=UPI003F91CD6E